MNKTFRRGFSLVAGPILLAIVVLVLTLIVSTVKKPPTFQSKAQELSLGMIYEKNGKVWMENTKFKLGFNPAWGGTISDLLINGKNIVNTNNGAGRGIQSAIFDSFQKYDDCSGCTGVFGWNPTQGGDIYNHGSPVVAKIIFSDTVYFKTTALEWYPNDKGGGTTKPIVSDTVMEQWTSFVPNHPDAIKIHYRITHNGQDAHGNNGQQIPVVTLTSDMNKLYYYTGNSPWQNGTLSNQTIAPGVNSVGKFGPFYTPESWIAISNGQNNLAVYTPGQQPYFSASSFPGTSGPAGVGANVISPIAFFAFSPGRAVDDYVYLIASPPDTARQTIAAIKQGFGSSHPFDPMYAIDSPAAKSNLVGKSPVSGWVIDILPIQKVEVLVDNVSAGSATLGLSRLDVTKVWPGANPNSGFSFSLNTANFPDGQHTITLKVTTSDGKSIISSPVIVTFSNVVNVSSTSVYRLVAQNGDHLYTASAAEVTQAQTNGYTLEGTVFKCYSSQINGTQAIYRLYNATIGDHFYTYSQAEVDYAVKSGWKLEGTAFYAYPSTQTNLLPVYRLINSKSQHFYTVSATERDQVIASGFNLEGIGFYVPSK